MINIDFPYHFDSRGRTALTGYEDHVLDMIKQLLFSNPGERVNRPDFGGGLLTLVFDLNSPEVAAVLQFNLRGALQRYLGDLIEVRELLVESTDAILRVQVTYRLRATGQEITKTIEGSRVP